MVNYDFPSNLEQYCHRVGRTGRDNMNQTAENNADKVNGPAGYSLSFFTRNMAPLANDLIALLVKCNQSVEPNLQKLATEFSQGEIIVDSCDIEEGDDEN